MAGACPSFHLLPFGQALPMAHRASGQFGGTSWFDYRLDFGDDWWHRRSHRGEEATGKYPRVIKRIGKSPPQYVSWDEDDEEMNPMSRSIAGLPC